MFVRPRFKQKAEPGRFNRTYNLGTGFSTRGNSTPYGYVGGRFFRYEQGVKSSANGSYGVEQYFGGSCVAIRDDFIFYTGTVPPLYNAHKRMMNFKIDILEITS